MNGLRIGSLFSGIGGLELGLERSGIGQTVWQCEIDPWARSILAKHWPNVARHDDVRTFQPEPGSADLVCGGFPCQDVSEAGQRRGIQEGTRSGLWSEYVRVVGLVRPRFVLVENVAALLRRGMDRVLGDLAALGYDAEWDCIPAAALGAPHLRDRVFILAHAHGGGLLHGQPGLVPANGRQPPQPLPGSGGPTVADANGQRTHRTGPQQEGRGDEPANGGFPVADPSGLGREPRRTEPKHGRQASPVRHGSPLPDAGCFGRAARLELLSARQQNTGRGGPWGPGWETQPRLGRPADGLPGRVDRLRGYGNAVVPPAGQFIGGRLRMMIQAQRDLEAP